jgi:hypothetical protein
MSAGMYHLIESFYRSITQDAPVPISYREILLTARIMDDIFAQLGEKERKAHPLDQIQLQAEQVK